MLLRIFYMVFAICCHCIEMELYNLNFECLYKFSLPRDIAFVIILVLVAILILVVANFFSLVDAILFSCFELIRVENFTKHQIRDNDFYVYSTKNHTNTHIYIQTFINQLQSSIFTWTWFLVYASHCHSYFFQVIHYLDSFFIHIIQKKQQHCIKSFQNKRFYSQFLSIREEEDEEKIWENKQKNREWYNSGGLYAQAISHLRWIYRIHKLFSLFLKLWI